MFDNMSHFFHIDILEPYEKIFAVRKVDVKVLVVDFYYGHYCTGTLFTFSMRTRKHFLKMAHITLRVGNMSMAR